MVSSLLLILIADGVGAVSCTECAPLTAQVFSSPSERGWLWFPRGRRRRMSQMALLSLRVSEDAKGSNFGKVAVILGEWLVGS